MSKKLSFILFLTAAVALFATAVSAQSINDETVAAAESSLAEISLPSGARRVKEQSVPGEVRGTLAKLVAAGGEKVRQGDSEVLIWAGDYRKSNGPLMVKRLENGIETALKNAGWEYEVSERNSEFVVFSLFRAAPTRRLLLGFFVPSDDAFVFALTEMVRADAPRVPTQTQDSPVNPRNSSGKTGAGNSNIVGKWWRGEGSGMIDYTGKTQYKSVRDYTFEFFADGTVEYVYDMDVLSIVQCRTKENLRQRGTYSISGDTLTINLNAGTSIGSSTCESKNNFKNTAPAEVVTKRFIIKKMESITRPDNPLMLCFDGQDDSACFEKNAK